MATKNFLFGLMVLILPMLLISGCAGLKTRDQLSGTKKPTPVPEVLDRKTPTTGAPVTSPTGTPSSAVGAVASGASNKTIDGAQRVLPRVGVILSSGGLKAFSHVGVLREFEKQHIPIHTIAGLEWGALVAALYSVSGKANDVEWKLMKLKREELPKKGLIGSAIDPENIQSLEGYFKTVFENKKVDAAALSFTCPAYSLKQKKILWNQQGSYVDALGFCLPYPPLLEPNRGWIAAATEVRGAAQILKQRGAEIVVLVNVLGDSTPVKGQNYKEALTTQVLWKEVFAATQEGRNWVDFVVDLPATDEDLGDFEARRKWLGSAQQQSAGQVQSFAKKFGF